MLKQELPLAYYQLLKMSEQERSTLIGVQGKILITGDMNSLEVRACMRRWLRPSYAARRRSDDMM